MINSGEYWDMMFTNGDKFTSGISLGAFQDITDMLADTLVVIIVIVIIIVIIVVIIIVIITNICIIVVIIIICVG